MTNHQTPSRTILLAGASGVFGVHTARALTAAGHRVLGLGRGPANDIRADLMDRDALLRAVAGQHADVVVHAATALRKPPLRYGDMAATNALRTDGTRNLLAAAREVGARRIIAESIVIGYGFGDHGDTPLTEQGTPFAPPGTTAQLEATLGALRTKEELTLTAEGIEGIALRFGMFYGDGGTDALLPMLRRRSLPVTPDRGRVLPWADLADAAAAVALAVDHGRPGQAYNIAGDEPFGFGAYVRLTAEMFGCPRPMTVPGWALRPLGYVHKVIGTNLRVDTALARTELGWRPAHPTVQDGLAALVRAKGQARAKADPGDGADPGAGAGADPGAAGTHSRSASTSSTASDQDRKRE